MRHRSTLLASAAVLVALTGCAQPVDTGPPKPVRTTTAPSTPVGSLADPYPLGTTVRTPDWTITLGQPSDVTSQVAAANPFNEPPPPGQVYLGIPVKATYHGEGSVWPDLELRVALVGSDGRVYDTVYQVIDGPLGGNELVSGGTDEGLVLVAAPAGLKGTWRLHPGLLAEPVFFRGA